MSEYTQASIGIANLMLDSENFRLGEQEGQDEAMIAMIEKEGVKLLNLAEDIVNNGLSPIELLGVVKENDAYVVLEGNRRLTAIKMLNSPDIVDGTSLFPFKKKLQNLSTSFSERPVEEIQCTVFPKRESLHHWMNLRHTGGNNGVGVSAWDAEDQERFREASGQPAKHLTARTILDFLRRKKYSIPESYPITNLTRLLTTPYVRSQIGIIDINPVRSCCPADIFAVILHPIVMDLSQLGAVNKIRSRNDRINYINNCMIPDFPKDTTWVVEEWKPVQTMRPEPEPSPPVEIIDDIEKEVCSKMEQEEIAREDVEREEESDRIVDHRTHPNPSNRNRLVPSSFSLHITGYPRVLSIFKEMKNLDARIFPNTCSILLRVFLELSLDCFIETHSEDITMASNVTLSNKLSKVAEYMKEKQIMTRHELTPINTMISDPTSFMSTTALNAYVHNVEQIPLNKQSLNTTWDRMQFFISKLWG